MAAPSPPVAPVTITNGASVAAAADTGGTGSAAAGRRASWLVNPMKISAVGRRRPASRMPTFTLPLRSAASHETISPRTCTRHGK